MLTIVIHNSISLKESFCDALHRDAQHYSCTVLQHEMPWHQSFFPFPADFPKFVCSEVSRNITPASLSSFFAIWQLYGL